MLNERLQRMRNKLWDSRPCITAERLELETEAYKQFAVTRFRFSGQKL